MGGKRRDAGRLSVSQHNHYPRTPGGGGGGVVAVECPLPVVRGEV